MNVQTCGKSGNKDVINKKFWNDELNRQLGLKAVTNPFNSKYAYKSYK